MIYGLDGEHCELAQGRGSFLFSWGLAVGIQSKEDFQKKYFETINNLKDEFDLDSERKVYCSYELKKELADEDAAYDFIEEFQSSIEKEIEKLIVVFSFFTDKKKITSFTEQDPSKLDVKDFHKRHLGDYYEHICAWNILDNQSDVEEILVDGFQGYRTRAWEELKPHLSNLKMVHKGDQISPIISTSDLLLQKMESDFQTRNQRIGKNEFKEYFEDYSFETHTEYLGTSLLALLTPTRNRHIPTHKIVREPVYLIMRPETSQIGKKELIDSPQGIKLQNKVQEEEGSLKFYNSREDKDKLKSESTLVYVGDDGEKEARTLVDSYGYDVNLVKFREI